MNKSIKFTHLSIIGVFNIAWRVSYEDSKTFFMNEYLWMPTDFVKKNYFIIILLKGR